MSLALTAINSVRKERVGFRTVTYGWEFIGQRVTLNGPSCPL